MENSLSPEKRHQSVSLHPTEILFPFSSQKVLGGILALNLKSESERLTAKAFGNAVCSVHSCCELLEPFFLSTKSHRILAYFEIGSKEGGVIDVLDLDLFQKNLEEEIEECIQVLVPSLFMKRNQEEVMRNLLTLRKEISNARDLPQAFLTYDYHDGHTMAFSVQIARVFKKGSPSLEELLRPLVIKEMRLFDLGALDEETRIEGGVFRVLITDLTPFFRKNFSIDFYKARKSACGKLLQELGEFRNFNGGMLVKQEEKLVELKVSLGETEWDPEFLENFFYSLSPPEVQATIATEKLFEFFKLFRSLFDIKANGYKSICVGSILYICKKGDEDASNLIGSFAQEHLGVLEGFIKAYWKQGQTIYHGYVFELKTPLDAQELLNRFKQRVERKNLPGKKESVLRLNNEFIDFELDPRLGGVHESSAMNKLLFEGLTRLDEKGMPQLAAAQSYTLSQDHLSYVFNLRSLNWTNGSPVTAFDFEYAWKKILSPSFATRFAYLFYVIRNAQKAKEGAVPIDDVGVKALDSKTLEVHLEYPAPYFLELVAHSLFSPVCKMLDERDPAWSSYSDNRFLCNGPFMLESPRPFYKFELKKNPNFWRKKEVSLDRVVISQVNSRRALDMFGRGEIDWLGAPFGVTKQIFNDFSENLDFLPTSKVFWYYFNTKRFPLNNLKIRKAIFYSISRENIMSQLSGKLRPAFSPLPLAHSQLLSEKQVYLEDQKIAYDLFTQGLKELAISERDFPPIELIYVDVERFYRSTLVLKEMLESSLGIRCILKPFEYSSLFQKLVSRDFMIGAMRWVAWISDPIYTLGIFKHQYEKMNFIDWESEDYKTLLNQARWETDQSRRLGLLKAAEKILVKSHAILPICYENECILRTPAVCYPRDNKCGIIDFSYAAFKTH